MGDWPSVRRTALVVASLLGSCPSLVLGAQTLEADSKFAAIRMDSGEDVNNSLVLESYALMVVGSSPTASFNQLKMLKSYFKLRTPLSLQRPVTSERKKTSWHD
ncbi:uncharacterized protein J7T54_005665 [Emericellopsis cladophorae]|uniref:Uncharacterized protein n=1 Tax=Emericellopsis cladophorae TaxID=2686198 RepID=A0A9Q0BG58_9HYPO|nr:uncharacterized protein J7T54_005665 [Emericellopsis cladophorae]KAI6783636.1 hypothetical protein J7T54_005665 [Emericellopsis cladophorae]